MQGDLSDYGQQAGRMKLLRRQQGHSAQGLSLEAGRGRVQYEHNKRASDVPVHVQKHLSSKENVPLGLAAPPCSHISYEQHELQAQASADIQASKFAALEAYRAQVQQRAAAVQRIGEQDRLATEEQARQRIERLKQARRGLTPAKPLLAGPKDPLPQPIALGQALLPELQVVEAHAQCYVENALPPSTPCLYGSTGGSVDNDAIDAAIDQCDAAAVEHYRYDSDEGRGSCHPSRTSVTSDLAPNDFSPSIQARVHVHSNSCSPSAAAGGLQGLLIQVAQLEERGAHVVYNAYRTMPSEAVLPPVLLARHRLMRHMHGSAAEGHTSMLPVSASPAAAHVSSAWDATPHAGSMHSPPRCLSPNQQRQLQEAGPPPWLAPPSPTSPSRTSPHAACNPTAAAARAALHNVFPQEVHPVHASSAVRAANSSELGGRAVAAGEAAAGWLQQGHVAQPQQRTGSSRVQGSGRRDVPGMPLSLKDEARRVRIANKVAISGLSLPALCSCGAAHPLDPTYTTKCCANCNLRGRPDLHEALLNTILRNAGLLS